MDEVARQFVQLAGQHRLEDDLQLIIDESGFAKKGKSSHGVARQYNGSAGKIDNCQVGVFAALNAGSLTSIVHAKLFDPASGLSKIDHARALIQHVVKQLKLPVKWVSFDAFYGRDLALLAALKRDNVCFVADVPENLQVCLQAFQMRVPGQTSKRGRKPVNKRPTHPFVAIREYAAGLRKKDFTLVKVRHSSKGKLKAFYHQREVYLLNADTGIRMKLTLLIRKDVDGTLKYSLCHASGQTTLKELAYQQSKRYFIERGFQDAKQELGMNEYQCRSEQSWLKHMALCMLAMLFINQEKLEILQQAALYLSATDVKQLMIAHLLFNDKQKQTICNTILAKAPPNKTLAIKKVYIRI